MNLFGPNLQFVFLNLSFDCILSLSLSHTNHNDAKIIFRYISNKTPTEYEHNIFISYRFWLLEKPT